MIAGFNELQLNLVAKCVSRHHGDNVAISFLHHKSLHLVTFRTCANLRGCVRRHPTLKTRTGS